MTMTNTSARLAPLMILLVLALGAANWYFAPHLATKWAVGMFFLPVAWGGLQVLKIIKSGSLAANESARNILAAITGAGIILAISLALTLAQTQAGLSEVWADRLVGALMGGVLIVMGNYLPKRLKPLGADACGEASIQGLQRFAGWTFVIGGIVYSLARLFLPLENSHTVAISAGVISLLLVIGRWLWVSYRAGRR